MTATPETQPLEPDRPRRGRHPLRRRLRRRHAAHRRPLHRRQRRVRQRPGDAAELPGRDPGPGRHHRRRLVVPGAHLRPRHRHAGRRAERARRDEPGGAQGQPRRPAARARRSSSTPTRSTSATSTRSATTPTRSTTTRSPRTASYPVPMTSITLEATQGARREAARRRALEELLRPRPDLVDVHAPDRPDHRVDRRRSSRTNAAGPRREPRRVQGRATTSVRPPSCSTTRSRSQPAQLPPGRYRNITGNVALAYGLIAAGQQAKLPILYASYPITPASDILHELSKHKNFGVRTLQAEDEIAAVGVAIGGAFAGQLGVTATSGPGRRPQVRGARASRSASSCRSCSSTCSAAARRPGCRPRPSRPTCCSRCTAATASRRCRSSPRSRRATASTPRSRRVRLALKYRTPVILLTDGYLANGSEPWQLPDVDALPDISVPFATEPEPRRRVLAVPARPRDARPPVGDPGHARPHAPHRRHREAGRHRQRQLRPGQPRAHDPHPGREDRRASPTTSRWSRSTTTTTPSVLVLGWGSTWGSIRRRCAGCAAPGKQVAHAHLVHLNPFPREPRRGAGRATRRCSSPR